MKSNISPETIRIMQCALDTRDSLRRLAASIDAAGNDPASQAEALRVEDARRRHNPKNSLFERKDPTGRTFREARR